MIVVYIPLVSMCWILVSRKNAGLHDLVCRTAVIYDWRAQPVSRIPTSRVGFPAVPTQLSHLDVLESESIHIFREVAAEFEKPVLLFSGGKDSAVMLRLAEKAFWPARIPFPVMHVDTGHNFDEVLDYRDRRVAELGIQLVVASVQESIDAGRVVEETGPRASRNRLQTVTLLDAITEHGFDAVFGGGRRDEEKARAKERVYSFRDDFGQWDPKNQRPELWNLYNGRHRKGEHIRVFPLSNWTELDIWQYIADDGVELPSIYYAHRREVFRRDGMWLAVSPFVTLMDGEEPRGDDGALPHRRRRVVHRRGRVVGGRDRRGDRRGRRVAHHRARRDPRRRPVHRGRHGRPQARGVLLTMELLRFATAGSVDDGKSTLIGRLLLETKQIFEDQLEAVERTSRDRGFDYTNLALLTDGLRAEREQGITIDVAYRYFATPRRKFIIADTPGHVQYTRNMVTGASTADLALVLIDARKGVLEQSRRHSVIASLLQVKHLVLCVNKMDLVDYSQERFDEICDEFIDFAGKLDIDDLTFIPISALHGDNVTQHSPNTPWYEGSTLLHHLEHLYIGSDRNLIDVRFPVQYVIRPMSHDHHDYRGYGGQVASGILRPGDEVVVLPERVHHHDRRHRRVRRPDRGGDPADVGERAPRRRRRRQPRRHDLPAQQHARGHPGRRRDGVLVQRAAAPRRARPTRSSTRRAPPRRACSRCTTGST